LITKKNWLSTVASLHRFVQKLTQLVDALENKQALINEVYSSGAVEGYTDEHLAWQIHLL
jgi:hypothetical protein